MWLGAVVKTDFPVYENSGSGLAFDLIDMDNDNHGAVAFGKFRIKIENNSTGQFIDSCTIEFDQFEGFCVYLALQVKSSQLALTC